MGRLRPPSIAKSNVAISRASFALSAGPALMSSIKCSCNRRAVWIDSSAFSKTREWLGVECLSNVSMVSNDARYCVPDGQAPIRVTHELG